MQPTNCNVNTLFINIYIDGNTFVNGWEHKITYIIYKVSTTLMVNYNLIKHKKGMNTVNYYSTTSDALGSAISKLK